MPRGWDATEQIVKSQVLSALRDLFSLKRDLTRGHVSSSGIPDEMCKDNLFNPLPALSPLIWAGELVQDGVVEGKVSDSETG